MKSLVRVLSYVIPENIQKHILMCLHIYYNSNATVPLDKKVFSARNNTEFL